MSAAENGRLPTTPDADRDDAEVVAPRNGDGAVPGDGARRRERRREREKGNPSDFWRACRSLYPYRGIVAVSVLCALFIGAAFTGGIGTMLPIMRVLIEGDTIQTWVNREVAARRLGVQFADGNESSFLQVTRVKEHGPAARAGLRIADRVRVAAVGEAPAAASTDVLSDPAGSAATLDTADGRSVSVALPPLPWYLAIGRGVAAHMPTKPVWAIAAVFGLIASLAVVSNVVKFFQEYLSDKAAVMAVNDIRRRLYDHVLHVPMRHFGSRGTSDITSRLVQDSGQLEIGFKTVLGQSIQEPIKAAFALGLALFISWRLTLFIVVFAPVTLAIIRKFGKKMRRASRKALESSAHMLGQIEATMSGVRVVKGASAERFERRRYARIMDAIVREQLRMSRIDAFGAPTIETLSLLVVGCVVLYASNLVLVEKTLPTTSFFLVMACLAGIGDSLRRVSKVNNVLQKANAAATRIFEVMALPVEERRTGERGNGGTGVGPNGDQTPGTPRKRVKLPAIRQEVRFENVTFTYPNASGPALVDVSLAVPKGQCVAVVGRNGSGKTTLLALLPRFYDPDSGRVSIDGVDLRDVTLRSLRGQISTVTQDSVIFPGTIAENIAYGNPHATREQIVAAAKRAFAHEFILEKPKGYDTLLGEMGGQLSGGQKQRLCIARAILRDAPILILDEATSQVDAESEHLIQQALEGLMHEGTGGAAAAASKGARTTFVIAHRFSTILGADTIVVMDRGRIVGQGRHEELLKTCETYQQLYERQLFAAPAA
jgi:ATP-binding cassette, subfamily B, bacterial MsbA